MPETPLDSLGALAVQRAEVAPRLSLIEVFTMEGLLELHWHGPSNSPRVVLACGGGMGGTLGPGLVYHRLGEYLAAEGAGLMRVGYRHPNDLRSCVGDVAAAADWAAREGARQVVVVGHSFGGAVAVQVGVALEEFCAGVVTIATQSAGCEAAEHLGDTPLLLIHGDRDEILPAQASEMVRLMAGRGELEIYQGAGHLFADHGDRLFARLTDWISDRWS